MAGYNTDGVFTGSLCENILIGLDQITTSSNVPAKKRSLLGFLDFLVSPLNKGGTQVIPYQVDSKQAAVRIKYMQRTVESEVTTSEDGNCTPERYPDFLETNFSVTRKVSYNFGLKPREVALICKEGNYDIINMHMAHAFDALARKINSVLLGVKVLNMGANVGNSSATSAKSINVLVGSTGAPLATGIQTLNQDYYEKNQYYGTPAVIGGGNIMKYFSTIATGCCNQDGVDMMALASKLGYAPFIDTQLETTFGSNQFIVMAPGMDQLVTFNRYVGENAGQMGTAFNSTVTDPITGLTYDMKIDADGCNEAYYVRLTLNYDLWYQPYDVFNAADPLYRTNGSLRYTAATT